MDPAMDSSTMLVVHSIDSLDLPELSPYRTMRRMAEHERNGVFVAEGEKVVRRLLQTNLEIVSLLLTAEWLAALRESMERRPETVQAYVAEKKLLETMVGFQLYHGLLAVARIPPAWSLDQALAKCARPYFLVALDGLSSSENLGVVVRNCAAFGVQALLIGEMCGSPWLRRAVRNSMGGIFHVPIVPVTNLAAALRQLAASGCKVVAAHPHPESKAPSAADFTGDGCLVFGSEGHGISSAVLQACPERVGIPMPAHTDSLNVSNAVAVFLYEVCRQRTRKAFGK
jgi:tRNA G18 (ribose-2'-O)-methylase SpoU